MTMMMSGHFSHGYKRLPENNRHQTDWNLLLFAWQHVHSTSTQHVHSSLTTERHWRWQGQRLYRILHTLRIKHMRLLHCVLRCVSVIQGQSKVLDLTFRYTWHRKKSGFHGDGFNSGWRCLSTGGSWSDNEGTIAISVSSLSLRGHQHFTFFFPYIDDLKPNPSELYHIHIIQISKKCVCARACACACTCVCRHLLLP